MAVATIEPSTDRLEKLQPLWHRSTPRRLVEKHANGNVADGWTAWQKHLARRKRPLPPPFLAGREPALLWGWPDGWGRAELAAANGSWNAEQLAEQIPPFPVSSSACLRASGTDVTLALQCVASAYALPDLAEHFAAESWWVLVAGLHDLAIDAQQMTVDWQNDPQGAVRQQLLVGELPLVLGYLLPEVRALRALRRTARTSLSEAIVEWTDGQGLLHARLLPAFVPLWACWTRARWMGERLKRGCWSREAEVQYQWLVRHAIRLTDRDGRLVLSESSEAIVPPPEKRGWPKGLYTTALDLAGDRGDCAAAAATLPGRVVLREINFDEDDLPDASLNSEWAGLAVLAMDWSRSAVQLALSYADDPLVVDLAVGREQFLNGRWTSRTTCDGEPVGVDGEWEEYCWQSDSTCDYLELGVDLTHGLRLERQLLLAREDRVLYLADVVLSTHDRPRQIAHTLELPLAQQVAWQPAAETRDGMLVAAKHRAAVLPLALTEWRCDPRGGRLEENDGKLALTQQTTGRALYCPLLFDLNRRRTKHERTWRQLTVAEALEVVPRDVAVGFRAQAGRDQWLFYRSLAPAGNRTLLGQNIAGEFCAGRFRSSSKLDEWIEIEA